MRNFARILIDHRRCVNHAVPAAERARLARRAAARGATLHAMWRGDDSVVQVWFGGGCNPSRSRYITSPSVMRRAGSKGMKPAAGKRPNDAPVNAWIRPALFFARGSPCGRRIVSPTELVCGLFGERIGLLQVSTRSTRRCVFHSSCFCHHSYHVSRMRASFRSTLRRLMPSRSAISAFFQPSICSWAIWRKSS